MVRYFDIPSRRIVCKMTMPKNVSLEDEAVMKQIEEYLNTRDAVEIDKAKYYRKRKEYRK